MMTVIYQINCDQWNVILVFIETQKSKLIQAYIKIW